MLFTSGVFPSALKIAKVVPVHEKNSKLDFSNYQPISLLSSHDKILEKLKYTRIFKACISTIFYQIFIFSQNDSP